MKRHGFLQEQNWLRFQVDDENFALPLSSVGEVAKPRRPYMIPMIPAEVASVIALRGEPLLVFNTSSVLMQRIASDQSQVIVVEQGPQRVGLFASHVDRVEQIALAPTEIEDDEEASARAPEYLVWRDVRDKRIGFLDPRTFLEHAKTLLQVVRPTAQPKGEQQCLSAF